VRQNTEHVESKGGKNPPLLSTSPAVPTAYEATLVLTLY
jgi:hypothetical protein